MNIFQSISTIKPTKRFDPKPVDDKVIGLILHMATFAPSAGNIQEWEFVVVDDAELKKKLAVAALHQKHIIDAPVVIVVCADLEKTSLKYGKRGEIVYALQDTAAATILMIVTANALGLGSDFVRAFDEEEVKDILMLPGYLRPVGIVPLGYPAEEVPSEMRIQFEKLTSVNRHNNKIEIEFKPIATYLEEFRKKYKKPETPKKKLTFNDFLKRLAE